MFVRGGSRAAATSKMERFMIIVNGFQPLTIISKRSILDVAAALDPPLHVLKYKTITANHETSWKKSLRDMRLVIRFYYQNISWKDILIYKEAVQVCHKYKVLGGGEAVNSNFLRDFFP